MKNRCIKSVLFICATLLFCACEQVDDIVNNVQLISGPSCCTTSHNVSWDGSSVELLDEFSKISFTSRLNGNLSFYYYNGMYGEVIVKKNGKVICDKDDFENTVIIRHIQSGDKITFRSNNIGSLIANIKVTGNSGSNSNNPDWDF